jgi:hypothetical protein
MSFGGGGAGCHAHGRRNDQYHYRLEIEDEWYRDRGELPPLRELEPLFGRGGRQRLKVPVASPAGRRVYW